ncbi:GntR family transcriptional regulator [Ketogulonicigenium robustum]|uniref:GntR family transcriptional regulator n=1 Tax=Ketogulonicigenium robustum TaxID=92947 RepID=A0A1W6P1C3_9RHOB|nr:GntR family transcriptional regulator [Ketogulonicigenium robustum]ARO15305.1 GntR family transcriptional regulator [Ketogulonicigenium robustum]
MLEIKQLARIPLHEAISERLRGLIVDGTLPPGEKLLEKTLCESFGVSRTPMREAIHTLAGEGLVTLIPNRGAIVARIDNTQVMDGFIVMEALEALAGKLAAPRMGAQTLAALQGHHAAMLENYHAGARALYYKHNRAIHDLIFEAAQNDVLSDLRRQVQSRFVSLRFAAAISAEEWALAVAEHEEMLVALKARDGDTLSEILQRHTQSKRKQVSRWLGLDPEPLTLNEA